MNLQDSINLLHAQYSTQEPKKFPLKYLLFLYITGHKDDLYCEYFKGFKLLVDWLSPIDIPSLKKDFKFAPYLFNYEQQEIANILKCSPYIVQQTLLEVHNGLKITTP